MLIHHCVVTGKENGYYQVSFKIEKQRTNYRVLADYYDHNIKIITSGIGFTIQEEMALAGHARIAKEEWEKQNLV